MAVPHGDRVYLDRSPPQLGDDVQRQKGTGNQIKALPQDEPTVPRAGRHTRDSYNLME